MTLDYMAKIEGHGRLDIDFSSGSAKLVIEEGERLFEAIVVGRSHEDIHFITPRICGVCPTAHNMASLRAIEAAFGVKPSKAAVALRKVMLSAQIVQSHALHLFFFALPDYIGIDSATELASKDPKLLKTALNLKNACDAILKAVGGRAVHPTTTLVGGFTRFPSEKEAAALAKLIGRALKDAEAAKSACERAMGSFEPFRRRYTEYLGLKDYYGDSDEVLSSLDGGSFKASEYDGNISETVKDYSSAKYGHRGGRGFMVGALARQVLAGKMTGGNPFQNNVAQAAELVQFLGEAKANLEAAVSTGLRRDEACAEVLPREGSGVGFVEAPRGTLYHKFWFDGSGRCLKADILTPTAQNLTNIEEDANALLDATKDKTNAERQRLLEMLVRAYDPCITCSVH